MRINANSLFLFFLGLAISIPSFITAGVGENQIFIYRAIGGVCLIVTTFYFAIFFAWKLKFFLKVFELFTISSSLLLILCFYPLLRLAFSSDYEIPRLLGSLNFAILPPSALYLYKLLKYNQIRFSTWSIALFMGPSLVGSIITVFQLNAYYLSISWMVQAFGFILPAILVANSHRIPRGVFTLSYIYLSVILVSGLIYSSLFLSRTLIVGYLISLSCLFFAISSPIIIILFVCLFLVFQADLVSLLPFQSFINKNIFVGYFDDSFLGSIGIANTREGVFSDFFSRTLTTTLIGNGSTPWFSASLGNEGEWRGGIEGLYLSISLEYGLIYGLVLILLVVISILFFFFRGAKALPPSSAAINVLLSSNAVLLGILPFSVLGIFFFNPQSSITLLFLFVFVYDSFRVRC